MSLCSRLSFYYKYFFYYAFLITGNVPQDNTSNQFFIVGAEIKNL